MMDRTAGGRIRIGVLLVAMALFTTLAAAPAFGQATAVNDEDNVTIEDSFNTICPQVITAFGNQSNYSNANATAVDESEAAAAVANQFDISIDQVNQCLSGGGAGDGGGGAADDQYDDGNGNQADDDVIDDTVPDGPLPETGGVPIAGLLLAGLALVVTGSSVLRSSLRRED